MGKGGALGSGSRPEILVSIVGGRGGGGGGGGAFGRCQTGSVQEDACRVSCRARRFFGVESSLSCGNFGRVFLCTVIISRGSVEIYSTDAVTGLFSFVMEIAAATVTVGWC